MKRTALILAVATALDLGVMAVAAEAQTAPSGGGSADLPVSAMQGGRVVASTRTNAQGNFALALPAGAYQLCVGGLGGGQSRSASANTCTAMTVPAPSTSGSTRSTTVSGTEVQPQALNWPPWLRWRRRSDPRIPFEVQPGPGQVVIMGTISGQ